MSSKLNPTVSRLGWRYFFKDDRARVYLLWLVIVAYGYLLLHFQPGYAHIVSWIIISGIGLGYMLFVMELKLGQAKAIFASWFTPITIGILLTIAAFQVESLAGLTLYVAVLWALLQAIGFAFNGLFDNAPARWYWFAAGINVALALVLLAVPGLFAVQYLLLAIVSTWSMANLWLLRSQYL